jgi:ABC-type phosphate transport system substrate-binding protein
MHHRSHILKRSFMQLIHRIGLAVIGCAVGMGSMVVRADVVAVVSSKSSIVTLTKNQVVDIFLGRRIRFPDGSPVVPIDQAEGSAIRDEFYDRFANMSPALIKAFWSKIIFTGRGRPPQAVANSAEAKKLVIANVNTIGYIDRSMVDSDVRVVLAP